MILSSDDNDDNTQGFIILLYLKIVNIHRVTRKVTIIPVHADLYMVKEYDEIYSIHHYFMTDKWGLINHISSLIMTMHWSTNILTIIRKEMGSW